LLPDMEPPYDGEDSTRRRKKEMRGELWELWASTVWNCTKA
jgi:hypothetical protein